MKEVNEQVQELIDECTKKDGTLIVYASVGGKVITTMVCSSGELALGSVGIQKELCEQIDCTSDELDIIAMKAALEGMMKLMVEEEE